MANEEKTTPPTMEVQREKGQRNYRDQIVNLVMEKFTHSENTFSQQFRRMARWYDLYRQIYQGKYHPFRNNVTIPLLFGIVQSDVSQKVGMMFSGSPVVTFLGGGPEDQVVARRQEALVNRQLEDSETYQKAVKFLTAADLYGTAVYRNFWRIEEGETQIRFDSGVGETIETRQTTKFNGPDWEPVDVVDFFPAPGYSEIEHMPGIVWRYWMDLEDVKIHAESGFFDKAGVMDLTFKPPSTDIDMALAWRRNVAMGTVDEDSAKFDKFSRPVEILEYWGRVPRNLVDDDENSRVITIANRGALLRNRPNPYHDKRIPFGSYSPTPDPHYFHAPGKVEIAAKLQYASNRLANQKLDALDLAIDPMWLASKRSGFDPRNLRTQPGKILWADREIGPDMIQPLVPDLSKMQNVYIELEQQSRWMQQGTGIIEDTVQGLGAGGSSRQTAREFVGRQESASRRILAEVRNAEKQWLEPLARKYVQMNRQFLPFPQVIRMIGADAVLDPITLQPIDPEQKPFEMRVNDMLPDYDIRAVGATRSLGLGARQQNMVLLLQTLQANPIAAAAVNWMAFFRQLFRTFEVQNVDELLNTQGYMEQVLAAALAGQQGSGSPSSGTNTPGQPAGAGGLGGGLPEILQGVIGTPGLGGQNNVSAA